MQTSLSMEKSYTDNKQERPLIPLLITMRTPEGNLRLNTRNKRGKHSCQKADQGEKYSQGDNKQERSLIPLHITMRTPKGNLRLNTRNKRGKHSSQKADQGEKHSQGDGGIPQQSKTPKNIISFHFKLINHFNKRTARAVHFKSTSYYKLEFL